MSLVVDPQTAYLILLVLGGHVGMSLLLATNSLSSHVKRHIIFVNFCITWMIYTLANTLLLYAGEAPSPHPGFHLCMVQSAMIFSSPPMISVSVLGFVLHLYLFLRENIYRTKPRWPKLFLITMLAAPYMVFILSFVVAISLANSQRARVFRNPLHCSFRGKFLIYLSGGIAAVAIVLSIVVEVLTAITLYRHWRDFRYISTKAGISISTLVRALGLLICTVIAFLTSLLFITNDRFLLRNFVLACLPLAVFLIFGTASDMLNVWCFWRRVGMPDEVDGALTENPVAVINITRS